MELTSDLDESMSLDTLVDETVIIGTSGNRYKPTDLLAELSTRQFNYGWSLLAPIRPAIVAFLSQLQEGVASGTITEENVGTGIDLEAMLRKGPDGAPPVINLVDLFTLLVESNLHLKLLAVMYLPLNADGLAMRFHVENVEAIVEDLMDLPFGVQFEAFKRFFTSASSSSPSTFRAVMRGLMTSKTTATT